MKLFERAESLLLDVSPVLSLYTYASNTLLKPYVRGFHRSPMDEYPLDKVWIDYRWREHPDAQDAEVNGD